MKEAVCKKSKVVGCEMKWLQAIKNYEPGNEQEARDKELMLRCSAAFSDILKRECLAAHLTASAFAINAKRDKTLMIYHKIYDSWSWTGGHADGEEDLLATAQRELEEETGLTQCRALLETPFALDVLPVTAHWKNGRYVPAHLHLSLTYLFEADEEGTLLLNEQETNGVAWVPLEKMTTVSTEAHMIPVYEKLTARLREWVCKADES